MLLSRKHYNVFTDIGNTTIQALNLTCTVNVLKFRTLHVIACHKVHEEQSRPRSVLQCIGVFHISYVGKHFVNFSPSSQNFIENRKRKVLEILDSLPYLSIYTQLQKKPISHFSGQLWKSELRNENIFIPYSVAFSSASFY